MSQYKIYYLIILVFMLAACTPEKQTPLSADDNISFTLLIDATDMPSGWTGGKPFRPTDDYCLRDCAVVRFSTDTVNSYNASHYVFVYDNPAEAIQVYKIEVEPRLIGEKPLEWNYVSEVADASGFACYQFTNVEYPLCNWKARYGRCIVEFGSWLVPERMSLDDFAAVVQTIDQIMLTSSCYNDER